MSKTLSHVQSSTSYMKRQPETGRPVTAKLSLAPCLHSICSQLLQTSQDSLWHEEGTRMPMCVWLSVSVCMCVYSL